MDFDVSLSRMANTSICNRNSQKPLTRYFPELIAALQKLRAATFVLDGEIVIPIDGNLSFDDSLMRIHPAKPCPKAEPGDAICLHRVRPACGRKRGKLGAPAVRERHKRLEAFVWTKRIGSPVSDHK
jgi:ATP-dependent DNA ligase